MSSPPLTRFPLPQDVTQALSEFAPLANLMDVDDTMEGAIPVITPDVGDLKCVACVYADPHQDLPFPRYTALSPIKVRPNAYLYIQQADGSVQRSPLHNNEMVLFDSHLKHWVDKPDNFPQNWDELSTIQKTQYKRDNMIVFANMDFPEYPSQEKCLSKIRDLLCLPQITPTPKNKKKSSWRK